MLFRSFATSSREAIAWNARCGAYRMTGDNAHAIADCSAALNLNRNFTWALLGRGLSLLADGRRDEARRDFETLLAIPEQGEGREQRIARDQLKLLAGADTSAIAK